MSVPAILILDEPAVGLSQQEVAALTELIRDLRTRGMTVLLIEHAIEFVRDVADQITVLDFGAKIAEGRPDFVLSDPRVVLAYLGDAAVPPAAA